MSPFLDVPFLPEESYVSFLQGCADQLDSVHFSLLGTRRLDNRIQLETLDFHEQLISSLDELDGPRKYALMNSRFYGPALLTDPDNIKPVIASLEQCAERGVIDGIVYCDHYFLQRLSDEAPALASALEAVPSVNTMLDSFAKVEAQLGYISDTHFQIPRKIILDRSLNRDLDRLADVARQCRFSFPDINIELLANEGCLPYCPFKLSHDAYIALANLEGRDSTFNLNHQLGCLRILGEQPHKVLQAPFIRPEDIDLYLCHVHTIKLCGRTLGASFLTRLINAYLQRSYDGNLLDLLDSMHWLADRLYVDNGSLSFDFANMLSMCDGRCDDCGFCRELFTSIARPLPLTILDNRAAKIDSACPEG